MTLRVVSILCALATGCALQYVVPDADAPECEPAEMACGDVCVDIADDDAHCGGCSLACAEDESCIDGDCTALECPVAACDGACIDTAIDPTNCGLCGRLCDNRAECIAGECVTTCDESCDNDTELCDGGVCECRSGLMRCEDDCVDPQTDDGHCGSCDRKCEDMFCKAGDCVAECGSADACEDACTDLATDPLNCGICERACHPAQVCVEGECTSEP